MLVRNYTVPSNVKGTVHAGTELIAATFDNITVTSISILLKERCLRYVRNF